MNAGTNSRITNEMGDSWDPRTNRLIEQEMDASWNADTNSDLETPTSELDEILYTDEMVNDVDVTELVWFNFVDLDANGSPVMDTELFEPNDLDSPNEHYSTTINEYIDAYDSMVSDLSDESDNFSHIFPDFDSPYPQAVQYEDVVNKLKLVDD
jgi:hypothetical protein